MEFASKDHYIAFLEAKVEGLERALDRRSEILRKIQLEVCSDDLLQISRIESGLPLLPRQAYELSLWPENQELIAADVEETLRDLWRSLAPAEGGEHP